jgi:DNA-binding IclR family transcriptional regulator
VPKWGFLTNHALVLLELARHPNSTLREIALAVGLTERAVIALLRAVEEEGIVTRWKDGRRNRYSVDLRAVMDHLGRQPISPYTLEQIALQLVEMAREARRATAGGDTPGTSR